MAIEEFFFFFFLLQVASLLGGWRGGWAAEGSFTVSTHNRAPICQIISQCGRTMVFICPNFIHHCLNTSSLYCDGSWERQLADRRKSGKNLMVKGVNQGMCDVGAMKILWMYDRHFYANLSWLCDSDIKPGGRIAANLR